MSLHAQLADHPLLAGMNDQLISAMESCARMQTFKEGDTLLRQDVEIGDFYLLLNGTVALSIQMPQSTPMPIQTLNAGDALGWSWLIPPYRSFFDATALAPVEVIALNCQALRDAMETNHDLGYALLKRVLAPMLSRLQACRLQLMDVYGQPGQGGAP